MKVSGWHSPTNFRETPRGLDAFFLEGDWTMKKESGRQRAEKDPGTGERQDAVPEERIGERSGRIAELEDALLRSRADHDNYRKRMERERVEWAADARAELLAELLTVADHLELGLDAAKDPAFGHLVGGFTLVLERLRALFAANGVESVGAAGEPFDPRWEEALATVADDSVPEDRVVTVVRRGYRLGSRLLRPALVTVSRGPENVADEAKNVAETGEI
jgi:molecular chaperone GrpE